MAADIPETRFARTPEGSIAYQVMGNGPVDVIACNSLSPVELLWDEPHLASFLTRLSSFSRHIWFDQFGVGASDWLPPTESRVLESNINAMVAVLDDVGCDRAAVLSIVAQEGLFFAATHPERTKALVLVDVWATLRQTDDHPEGFTDEVIERRLQALDSGFADPADPSFASPSLASDERFSRWFKKARHLAWSPANTNWYIHRAFQTDLRHVLASVRVPTLVVSHQGLPAPFRGRYLAEHIEGARQVEVPGGDYVFFARDTGPMLDAIEEFLTGRLPVPDPDRVLSTVVFTDVVESTAHAARLGDQKWRQVVENHETMVRQELDRFRGREIRTTGDGFLAIFDGPAHAVRCACAIRDSLRAIGLETRAGVHTGEIEVRGEDIAGIAVHVAQRVQAAAAPGEVLVSETVPRIVFGSGIEFDDRGEYELKGVPGTWRLFAVAG